ncbi:hypothetical protein NHF40_13555 [Maricaulaceae bacterium EIL42A08]|nr:hypothetical protein [Maricaulaceae bacterium EIL42A08]
MRYLPIFVLFLTMSACATSEQGVPGGARVEAATTNPVATVSSLPAQRLDPGQCGLFLFGTRQPFDFVLFEDEAARQVTLVHGGSVYEIAITSRDAAFIAGDAFQRSYSTTDDGLRFTLDGTVGEQTSEGQQLNDVILTAHQLDGTRVVRPLAGVRRCDEGGPRR